MSFFEIMYKNKVTANVAYNGGKLWHLENDASSRKMVFAY